MPHTVAQIAQLLDGQVTGDANIVLKGFAPADHARAGDLTFAENEDYFKRAASSHASAIIVAGPFQSEGKAIIRVSNARVAFARVLPLFFPEPTFKPGVHTTAIVDPSAVVDATSHIGAYCVIGARVRIGARSVLECGDFVGADTKIGDDVRLYPNVTIYHGVEIGDRVRIHAGTVIGSDGFGYVLDGAVHRKVPQIGNVLIRDDVEIGANVTVDRGALGPTVIGKGSKIDNLVQIAHNVTLGEHCLVVAQAGISGSTSLGSYVTLAGQVGLAGHLKLGNRVIVAAQSGVMHDIPDDGRWFGYPAQPDRQTKRQILELQHLPDLRRRVVALEKKLGVQARRTKETE
jgi:UDP-3-O-[3-hydroxymyristoyl] glucosamine N-acyltransferase